jgi:RNA polymerase sigma-70 factor (ECF subfamily)
MQSDDRHLVRRCLAGDQRAFDTLYDRHSGRVFHLLRRLTASEAEAEDLAQETFLTAYRSLASWRGEGAFGTWLCGIAVRLYANARRRAHPTTGLLDEEAGLAAPDADPLAHCLRQEQERSIEQAIALLPRLYREIFVLVQVEGLTCREAARWLDVPLGTARWRLWRAACLLQAALVDLLGAGEEGAAAPARVPKKGKRRSMAVGTKPERLTQSEGG